MKTPTAAPAPITSVRTFVVTQVRHALQHVVTIGACSPYFPAACERRPVQICFTFRVYALGEQTAQRRERLFADLEVSPAASLLALDQTRLQKHLQVVADRGLA
jgi:hypothetical protein